MNQIHVVDPPSAGGTGRPSIDSKGGAESSPGIRRKYFDLPLYNCWKLATIRLKRVRNVAQKSGKNCRGAGEQGNAPSKYSQVKFARGIHDASSRYDSNGAGTEVNVGRKVGRRDFDVLNVESDSSKVEMYFETTIIDSSLSCDSILLLFSSSPHRLYPKEVLPSMRLNLNTWRV
jgi:hypothetical protein